MTYRSKLVSLSIVLAITFLPHDLSVANAAPAKDFDEAGDGLNPEELSAYFVHLGSKMCDLYGSFDKKKDGEISSAEYASYRACVETNAARHYHDFLISIGKDPQRELVENIPSSVVDRHVSGPKREAIFYKKTATPDVVKEYGGLLVRSEHQDIFLWTPELSFERAESAFVSYTHDFDRNNNIYAVKGALIYPIKTMFRVTPTPDNVVLSAYSIIPSISLDWQDDSQGLQKPIDALTFRLGTEWEFGGGLFNAVNLRFNGVYSTDTNFRSEIGSFETDIEPIKIQWGLGAANEAVFDGVVGYQLRTILHLEAGDVFDAGRKTNLQDREFVRIGPNLRLDVWFPDTIIDRVTGHVAWQYFAAITPDTKSSELFQAGLDFRLDDAGHFNLGVLYRNGEIPLALDETETIKATFKVKF